LIFRKLAHPGANNHYPETLTKLECHPAVTSHGGTVLAGLPFSDCDGKPIARVGNMASCPKFKGVLPIAEGDKSNIVDGAPLAYDDCKTAC
jgi:uncharacterized Zn-binding protein involved in type VI secretion